MKYPYLLFSGSLIALLCACQPQQSATTTPASSDTAASATQATKLHGTDIRNQNIGGDFTMTDGNGNLFQLSKLKGKVVILSFGYTHCPDICPTELLTYKDTIEQLGESAKDVSVVFASVDPERDTPELIGKYVKQFHPDFIGLTVTGDQSLPLIKQQYQVVSAKANQQSEKVYLVDHSAGTYLLDKNGEVAIFAPYGSTAAQIADDIKTLL
ncbi:SCO family protein [Neisseria sp. S1]|uniref:SCO family protein n=1 Tax=Neisseria sp. S1 TaxID=3318354 RepID=UPI003A83E145